jgi:hypothetical protein
MGWSPVAVHTPTHWNLIGRRIIVLIPCVIAQQYASAIFISLRVHSRKEKFRCYLKNIVILFW